MAIEVPDWYRTVALVGVDDTGEPVVVLLDSTGAIVSVMKATYAGALKNVACDSQGRMIMIPTDPADVWGNAISMGNAELAARLTGLGGYDRRGNVLFFDTFEHGLSKGTSAAYGTGASVTASSKSVRGEGLSLTLTAGSDGDKEALFWWYLPYPVLGRVGFELPFTVHANTTYVAISLILYDGSDLHAAEVRYDKANSRIQYVDVAGVFQDLITGVVLVANDKAYHILKMVIDLSAKHYHRVLVDSWSWTTGSLDYYTYGDPTTRQFYALVDHVGAGGSNPVSYVDSVIITQNEPA